MQTDLRLKFHQLRIGDGEIVLTLEHDKGSPTSLVGIGFSFRAVMTWTETPHEWSVVTSTGTYGYLLKRFALELRNLAQTLKGTARLDDEGYFIDIQFQVVDRDAGKIGVSGCIYRMAFSEFPGVTWPFNPAPDTGFKFLFSDIWMDVHDLPGIADQIEQFLHESGVHVGEDYWNHTA